VEGGGRSVSHPGHSSASSGKISITHGIRGLISPRESVDAWEKRDISCPCWKDSRISVFRTKVNYWLLC
jgi:hypothetical protein